jgi:hypothetical protein
MISRSTDIKAVLRSRQRGFFLNSYRFTSGPHISLYPSGPDSPKQRIELALAGSTSVSSDHPTAGESLLFSGADTSYASGSSLSIGSGDFVIEEFLKMEAAGASYSVALSCSNLVIRFGDAGFGGRLQVGVNTSILSGVWNCALTRSSFIGTGWRKLTFNRIANVCRFYVDDQLQSLAQGTSTSYSSTSFNGAYTIPSAIPYIGSGVAGKIADTKIVLG